MLWTFSVVLLILWLLGLISDYTMGGFIHILLVSSDHRDTGQGDQGQENIALTGPVTGGRRGRAKRDRF